MVGRRDDHVEVVGYEAGHGGVDCVQGAASGARPFDDGSPAARVVQRAVVLDALAVKHAPRQGRRPAVWRRVWGQYEALVTKGARTRDALASCPRSEPPLSQMCAYVHTHMQALFLEVRYRRIFVTSCDLNRLPC